MFGVIFITVMYSRRLQWGQDKISLSLWYQTHKVCYQRYVDNSNVVGWEVRKRSGEWFYISKIFVEKILMAHQNYIPIKSSYLCTPMSVPIYFAKESATFFDKTLMITAQLVAKTGLKPYMSSPTTKNTCI